MIEFFQIIFMEFLTLIIFALVFSLPFAWITMLLVGILHSQLGVIPAFGLKFVWPAVLLIRLLLAPATTTTD